MKIVMQIYARRVHWSAHVGIAIKRGVGVVQQSILVIIMIATKSSVAIVLRVRGREDDAMNALSSSVVLNADTWKIVWTIG